MQQRIAPGRHERPAPPRRAAPTQTPSETPTCTRAAGDVGPYHTAPGAGPSRAHGRARRPRRAAPTQTPSETPACTRAAGTSAPTTPPPARVLRAPMVGRDVPGAPRQRKRHRKRPRIRGPPGDVGPYHVRTHGTCPYRAPMVGRDVPGAPRQRKRHRKRPRVRGPPGRRPLPRTHTWRRPLPRAHGRARRPRRAAPTQTPSETPACTRAAWTSAPATYAHMAPAPTARPWQGATPRHVKGRRKWDVRHRLRVGVDGGRQRGGNHRAAPCGDNDQHGKGHGNVDFHLRFSLGVPSSISFDRRGISRILIALPPPTSSRYSRGRPGGVGSQVRVSSGL